jgi:hypothetical protein
MRFTIKLVIDDGDESEIVEEIIQLEKDTENCCSLGISLVESKQLMKILQNKIILQQSKTHLESQMICQCCHKKRHIKGYHSLQYRTLFGIVNIPSIRLFHCQCDRSTEKTFSPLNQWLSDKNSHELKYIETKWASLISFSQTANLLKDVLPVGETENSVTIRNHLHTIAKRQEKELEDKPEYISYCQNELDKLPKPDKPITVGIDGGYLKKWHKKNKNFEIVAGKAFSSTKPARRFGLVQAIDDHPRRRLMHVLTQQGMQLNQQIHFLSDGADNVRDLQYMMYPESEHILDWFHITMRITVLNQFAKGLLKSDPSQGKEVKNYLESIKWFLWHGNVEKALDRIEDCYIICIDEELKYRNRKKLENYLDELNTYIENNCHLIPNYGERWRYGEAISTGFVESTINEVVAKRMVKKQQMQWTQKGAHYMIQTRTAVLNDELHNDFSRWYPGFTVKSKGLKMKKVA